MERIVVKIGGSAITYKESEFFPTKIEDIKKDFEKYASFLNSSNFIFIKPFYVFARRRGRDILRISTPTRRI
jgi:CRISPR/Cas system CSM-associated protein Csm4 (group 5 of RAMP superfamily)